MDQQINGQTDAQPEKERVLYPTALSPELPEELRKKVAEAEALFQTSTQRKQELLTRSAQIQHDLQGLNIQLIAAQGFLGVIYQIYPSLRQIEGILPERD